MITSPCRRKSIIKDLWFCVEQGTNASPEKSSEGATRRPASQSRRIGQAFWTSSAVDFPSFLLKQPTERHFPFLNEHSNSSQAAFIFGSIANINIESIERMDYECWILLNFASMVTVLKLSTLYLVTKSSHRWRRRNRLATSSWNQSMRLIYQSLVYGIG